MDEKMMSDRMVSNFRAVPRLSPAKIIVVVLSTLALWSLLMLRQTGEDVESSTFNLIKTAPKFPTPDSSSFLPVEAAAPMCEANNMMVYPHRTKHRKVYDLFLIGTELDWAEIRMNELARTVDYFVILESPSTFTNKSKPLYFKENWERFSRFAPQIIYHVLDDSAIKELGAWDREHYQRNAMMDQIFPSLLAEKAPQFGDVIIVSDTDEIPRSETVSLLRNCAFPPRVTLSSRFYLYSFQWHTVGNDWHHPQATYWQGENTVRPEDLRGNGGDLTIGNASWSCTTCFQTVAEVVRKINSFSHQEYNQEKFKIPSEIVRRVRNGIDIFDRDFLQYEKYDDQLDVPRYLTQNPERFAYLLDRDPLNANFKDYPMPDGAAGIPGLEWINQ